MSTREKIVIDTSQGPAVSANNLLAKTLVHDGMISLPVDVERIANHLGIEVQRIPLDSGTDGLLVKDSKDEGFKAVVDANANPHRARFTLAHEIGHYIRDFQNFPENEVMGIVQKRDEMSSRGTDPDEVWANRFAAALLMPASVLADLWGKNFSREEIADIFNVSETSLGHRLHSLGLR